MILMALLISMLFILQIRFMSIKIGSALSQVVHGYLKYDNRQIDGTTYNCQCGLNKLNSQIRPIISCSYEEFEDTKRVSESVYRRRTDNTMAKRKSTKDIQRYTKHTYKIKDRVTLTPLKTGDELRCPGRVGSSFSTRGTHRVNPHNKKYYSRYMSLPKSNHYRISSMETHNLSSNLSHRKQIVICSCTDC